MKNKIEYYHKPYRTYNINGLYYYNEIKLFNIIIKVKGVW